MQESNLSVNQEIIHMHFEWLIKTLCSINYAIIDKVAIDSIISAIFGVLGKPGYPNLSAGSL